MEENKRIPANIFEEMAGVQDAPVPVAIENKESVNISQEKTKINYTRLKKVANEFSKLVIKDFNKKFLKVAKGILKLQKNEEIVNKPQELVVKVERTLEEEEPEEKEESFFDKLINLCIKYVPPPYKYIFVAIKYFKKASGLIFMAAIGLIKFLWFLGKMMVKTVFKVVKTVIDLGIKFIKAIYNIIKPILSKFIKFAFKAIKTAFRFMMRMMLKIVRTIWKIVKFLFFRGKKASKPLFKGEPAPSKFEAAPFKTGDSVTVKFKPLKGRESFIMRLIKKAFRPIKKLFFKVITKLFGKLLKKLVKMVIKIIVGFVFGQVLGSCVPLIGNALGFIYGVGNALVKITSIGMLIYETFQDVRGIADDLADSSDDDDGGEDESEDDEEELPEDEMQSSDFRKVLNRLEKEKQHNSPEYIRIKQKYLESLIEENRAAGNKEIADMIRCKLDQVKGNNLKDFDLKLLDKDIERQHLIKEAKNSDELISEKSLSNILNDKTKSNYVRWLELYNNLIKFIKVTLFKRLEYNTYKESIEKNIINHFEPRLIALNKEHDKFVPSKKENENDKQIYKLSRKNAKNAAKIFWIDYITFDYFKSFKKYTLENLAERLPVVKKEVVYVDKKAEPFYDIKKKENEAQKVKYNLWVDVLNALDVNDNYKNKYQKQALT